MIAVGQFLKTFGVNGLIKFRSHSGEIEHLSKIKTFCINTTSVSYESTHSLESHEVEAWYLQSNKTIRCKIVGFDSPEDAHYFVSKNMYVPREQATKCKNGEYYIGDLVGMRIMHCGKMLGVVSSVFTDAYAPLLEVVVYNNAQEAHSGTKGAHAKRLIPFMKEFVSDPVKMERNSETQVEGETYAIELYDVTLLN